MDVISSVNEKPDVVDFSSTMSVFSVVGEFAVDVVASGRIEKQMRNYFKHTQNILYCLVGTVWYLVN